MTAPSRRRLLPRQRAEPRLRRRLPAHARRSGPLRARRLQRPAGGAGLAAVSLRDYVTSSTFGVDVMENWQSEYLQFFLFIFATVWLVQLGSNGVEGAGQGGQGDATRSRRSAGTPSDDSPAWAKVGGWRTALLLAVARAADGRSVPADLGRLVDRRLGRLQQRAAGRPRGPGQLRSATSARPTSGTGPSRTGSRRCSRSARWRSSRSTCASAAPPESKPVGGAARVDRSDRLTGSDAARRGRARRGRRPRAASRSAAPRPRPRRRPRCARRHPRRQRRQDAAAVRRRRTGRRRRCAPR